MSTLRLPMRTSPGPHPSRSPKTSKYMYKPAFWRSLGRVKLRHFSKMSFDALPFFLPVMSLVDKRMVLSSIRKFGRFCTALPPSPQGSDSSVHYLPVSRTFRSRHNRAFGHCGPKLHKNQPQDQTPDILPPPPARALEHF